MPKLVNASTGETILESIEVADTFWKRFKGYQFRRFAPTNTGLLLSPCSSLHTCFMRFPIDVIMLDQDNIVLSSRRHIAPWRAVICRSGTVRVIETAANALNLAVGTKLRIEMRD
jgi:uncharacterized membrane protein (UPF0127 family)